MSDELTFIDKKDDKKDDKDTDVQLSAVFPLGRSGVVPRRPFMKVKLESLPADFQAAVREFQQVVQDSKDQLAEAVKTWNQVGFPSSTMPVVESPSVLPLDSSPALSAENPTADNASQPSHPFLNRPRFHAPAHDFDLHLYLGPHERASIDTAISCARMQWGIGDVAFDTENALVAICRAYIASQEEPA